MSAVGLDRSQLGGVFDLTGVTRRSNGIKRYHVLPRNLVHMLRASVERRGVAEAVVETSGGPRLSYAEPWDRAARGAGGPRPPRPPRGATGGLPHGHALPPSPAP